MDLKKKIVLRHVWMLTVDKKELKYNFIFILQNNKLLLITNYNLLHLFIWAIPLKKTRNTLTFQKMYVKRFSIIHVRALRNQIW